MICEAETMKEVTESIMGMEAERGRWILVILGMIINLCLGTIYSWSVFVGPLTNYFTKTWARRYLQATSCYLSPCSLHFSRLRCRLQENISKDMAREMSPSSAVSSPALAGSLPRLQPLSRRFMLYGIIGGIGVGIAYGVPVAVAARWFPDRRGLAVGLTVLGFGFSAFFTANIAGYLIGGYGVMNTFRIFGVAFIILTSCSPFPSNSQKPAGSLRGWTPPHQKPVRKACEFNAGRCSERRHSMHSGPVISSAVSLA